MRQEIRKSCPIWDKKSEHQFVSSALGPEIREVLSFVQMAADGRSSRNKKWGGAWREKSVHFETVLDLRVRTAGTCRAASLRAIGAWLKAREDARPRVRSFVQTRIVHSSIFTRVRLSGDKPFGAWRRVGVAAHGGSGLRRPKWRLRM
jgi:hypothetical protein